MRENKKVSITACPGCPVCDSCDSARTDLLLKLCPMPELPAFKPLPCDVILRELFPDLIHRHAFPVTEIAFSYALVYMNRKPQRISKCMCSFLGPSEIRAHHDLMPGRGHTPALRGRLPVRICGSTARKYLNTLPVTIDRAIHTRLHIKCVITIRLHIQAREFSSGLADLPAPDIVKRNIYLPLKTVLGIV